MIAQYIVVVCFTTRMTHSSHSQVLVALRELICWCSLINLKFFLSRHSGVEYRNADPLTSCMLFIHVESKCLLISFNFILYAFG